MNLTDSDIRRRLRLGEDSGWEFKRFEFRGDVPASPRREDLADEMAAFANARGGALLCGVEDDGRLQDMSPTQMAALDRVLVEAGTDAVEPPLRIEVHRRELDGRGLVLVIVPRGDAVHERSGRAFIRVGATKRRMGGDERLRLAQSRAQSRYLWFDRQVVPGTGFETLDEKLWGPLLSVAGAADPSQGLANLRLLTEAEGGVQRATVAGVLLCARRPQEWFPQAAIIATHYRGANRASGQLDGREITGPLPEQIAAAVGFVVRNMRVAARKTPARENLPQYSLTAVFEAVVNAVAHRDYSIASQRIRLSMFSDRLEIDSPGRLANGMTISAMASSQATRNEVIASVFGRFPVGDIPGSEHRLYLMERRGDGVPIIIEATRETTGLAPRYELAGETGLVLTVPAAKLHPTPAQATVAVHHDGVPLPGVDVVALFPNKTRRQGTTDDAGEVAFDLHSTHLPMTVYAAAPGHAAKLERAWIPREGGLVLALERLPDGGATIFPDAAGHIPGLSGRLRAVRDTADRTHLHAGNIAIEQGRQQPVHFRFGRPMRLTDAYGVEMSVTILDILGSTALAEYRPFEAASES